MQQHFTLRNGLTVLTTPLNQTNTVAVFLSVAAGSRYETPAISGISHFLEHLMFKGTRTRPSTLAISRELDTVGAEYNAYTSKDHTAYYIKVGADHLALALDLLSDMMFHSLYDATEMNRERGVILEEINMYQDNPMMHVENVNEELVFAGSTLGWQVIGGKPQIRAMSRSQIVAYWQKFYHPKNMVLSIAGKVSDRDRQLINKYFDRPARAPYRKNSFRVFKSRQQYWQHRARHRDSDQVQLALGWPSFGYHHPQQYAANLLSIILGGTMSSRLFIEVREKRGLAYSVRASNSPYQDSGCLMIQAGLDKKRWRTAVEVMLAEIEDIKQHGPRPEELHLAKEFVRGHLAISLEDSAALAQWYGQQQLLTGATLSPETKIKKLLAVSGRAVQTAAQTICCAARLNLAIIGPVNAAEVKKVSLP
ncbi:insulinase family protein [Candidatus Falkowbacteria bacterium]|nr:insulinase family protein [Candidatus Falkowbacteria bacterium]